MTPAEHQQFLRKAFDAFQLVRATPGHLPAGDYLPYDIVDLRALNWRAMGWILVEDDLRELTNNLNAWLSALRRWHAWSEVALNHSEDERWELEHEFIAVIATYCLFQPSAIRDTITFVATQGIHQVLCATDATYEDRLPLDGEPWDKPSYPTRRKKEEQLQTIADRWPKGKQLLAALRQLDDAATRKATSDYRNRASHSIAPRFSRGVTRAVTRTIVQAAHIETDSDGRAERVPIPGKATVSYGFGGTEPLDLGQVRAVNLKQFEIAVACFHHYISLLKTAAGPI